MDSMTHMWGFGMGLGWVFMILFWVAVIIVIIALVKWFFFSGFGGSSNQDRKETALEVLKKRYARGEIDKDEFEKKKRDLEG